MASTNGRIGQNEAAHAYRTEKCQPFGFAGLWELAVTRGRGSPELYHHHHAANELLKAVHDRCQYSDERRGSGLAESNIQETEKLLPLLKQFPPMKWSFIPFRAKSIRHRLISRVISNGSMSYERSMKLGEMPFTPVAGIARTDNSQSGFDSNVSQRHVRGKCVPATIERPLRVTFS